MGRTPLARRLQAVAHAHQTADATGAPADEVLGAQLSRRRFLTGAAALAGATALSGMTPGRASAASAPRLLGGLGMGNW